ncbi:1039_t:CDS:2, partial [Dentiscutata erythropus]
ELGGEIHMVSRCEFRRTRNVGVFPVSVELNAEAIISSAVE